MKRGEGAGRASPISNRRSNNWNGDREQGWSCVGRHRQVLPRERERGAICRMWPSHERGGDPFLPPSSHRRGRRRRRRRRPRGRETMDLGRGRFGDEPTHGSSAPISGGRTVPCAWCRSLGTYTTCLLLYTAFFWGGVGEGDSCMVEMVGGPVAVC